MKKDLLIEINRYRQLMGSILLTEGGKVLDEFLPLTPRSVDNLTKSGLDFTNDLTKLSDEFANIGVRTWDDLANIVAKNQGMSSDEITDQMIREYIKSNDKLYTSILVKASETAEKQVDILVKNANITKVFSKNPNQLNTYTVYISTAPSARNVDTLITGLDDSIDEIDRLIDDVQSGKIPGVTSVPKELEELYEDLLSKKAEVDEFKNRDTSPTTPSKSLSTEIKWGNLGNGYTISNKITNYGGRYVVMVKDANGRLRPFYQRTGGGGADDGWAARGNFVPFYGIADVTLQVFNKETNQYELKRITSWMIKPENGRMGEEGDDLISSLLGDVVGTNGVKDFDYDLGNFSKSMTNTPQPSEMNTWLRKMGYEITPENGFLKKIKPPSVLHGIP